ncbi:reprolysin-like metallopeptidase [Undibacterium sp. TJN19]|uniref:reprolysin-like metallopeptidase n=1 Tax=Undibacterium sp. TJN19 TaxID=3413055 RepID=UPI003BF0C920
MNIGRAFLLLVMTFLTACQTSDSISHRRVFLIVRDSLEISKAGVSRVTMDIPRLFSMKIGEKIGLSLKQDEHLTFQIDDIETVNQYRSWTAHLVKEGHVYRAVIVQTGEEIVGSIDLPTGAYRISGSTKDIILQDVSGFPALIFEPNHSDGMRPSRIPPSPSLSIVTIPDPGPIEVVHIRVLTLITRELANSFPGGLFKLKPYLNLLQQKARQAMKDSRVYIELDFLEAPTVTPIDGIPMGASNLDTLKNITPSEGPIEKWSILIRNAKRSTNADLVVLFTSFRGGNCGVAWIGGHRDSPDIPSLDLTNAAQIGYSVVNVNDSNCDQYTLSHEIGHNLGSVHDYVTQSSSSERGAFNYSFGHRGQRFVTIMGYPDASHTRLGYFSNPDALSCLGQPCGIMPGLANAADNFDGFNSVRAKVSQWHYFRDLSIEVQGQGSVVSTYLDGQDTGFQRINCPSNCFTTVPSGRVIRLTAVPDRGFKFLAWRNSKCSNSECDIHNQDVPTSSVVAIFAALQRD